MKPSAITYRLEALDADGEAIETMPIALGSLNGVLVFEIDKDVHFSQEAFQRLHAYLKTVFPDHRILILTEGVRFVRLVPVELEQ